MAISDSELAPARLSGSRPVAHARRRGPRRVVAVLLSLLLPGLGHLAQGRMRRGVLLLLPSLAVAGLVLWAWLEGPLFVVSALLRGDVLLALLAANAAAFLVRAFAVADTWRHGPRAALRRRVLALPALAMLAFVAAPHVVAGYYDFRAYDLLTSVFTDEEPTDLLPVTTPLEPPPAATPSAPVAPPGAVTPPPAAPASPAAPSAPPAPAEPSAPAVESGVPADPVVADDWLTDDVLLDDPLDPVDPGAVSRDDGSPVGAPSVAEGFAAAPASRAASGGWLTMLLAGGDAGPGRSGLRTDTMIVVAIQAGTGKAVAFGVPRNMTAVPLPGRAGRLYGSYDDDILNALYQWGNRHPDLFPGGRDPGATALKQTLSLLLGLQIRYYALVDLAGFVDLVDAVGGVDITATERVQDKVSPPHEGEPWIVVDVHPGERYHFDGRQALAYARSRWATSDYNRMQRQRCLLSAMAEQLDVATVLRSFPKVASVIKRSLKTDIPLRRLPDLARLIGGVDPGKSASVSFITPTYTVGVDEKTKGFPPDLALIRDTVRRLILEPATAVRGQGGIETLGIACG